MQDKLLIMKKQITTSAIALMLICASHSASAATTVITLSGNLSARDLAENSDLKTAHTIDLSEAAIVEYSDKEPIVGNYTYYPLMSFQNTVLWASLPKLSSSLLPLRLSVKGLLPVVRTLKASLFPLP